MTGALVRNECSDFHAVIVPELLEIRCAIVDSVSLHLSAGWCSVRERSNDDAMDHQFDLNRDVAFGNAVVLHDEWVYSHSPRDRNRNSVATVDRRPPHSVSAANASHSAAIKYLTVISSC